MKIKRYFGPDMRQALRMVREELGPDAVILSNRRVEGGIEIVAATDYDENLVANTDVVTVSAPAPPPATPAVARRAETQGQPQWTQDPLLQEMRSEMQSLRSIMEHQLSYLSWGDIARRKPSQMALIKRLLRFGMDAKLCREFADNISEADGHDELWKAAQRALTQQIPVADDDILAQGGVVALVGPTGVGKTTTVAKLAARYAMRYGSRHIALVTTDNFRIGAHEQLRAYGRILNIPVRTAGDVSELRQTVDELAGKGLVLVDTAGMSQRDIHLCEQLSVLAVGKSRIKNYLVLSAASHVSSLSETVRAFRGIGLNGCILTKTDESASLGAALGVTMRERLPIAYVSDGQRVPEDIHVARAGDLVARGVAIMEERGQEEDIEFLPLTVGRTAVHAY